MPKTSDMIPSRFVQKGDIGPGVLWTIKKLTHEEIGRDEDAEMKWVLYFNETQKAWTLNKTNIKLLETICMTDEADDWVGKQVVLYWDPTVDYMGKVTGGIRVRAPKTQQEKELPF